MPGCCRVGTTGKWTRKGKGIFIGCLLFTHVNPGLSFSQSFVSAQGPRLSKTLIIGNIVQVDGLASPLTSDLRLQIQPVRSAVKDAQLERVELSVEFALWTMLASTDCRTIYWR